MNLSLTKQKPVDIIVVSWILKVIFAIFLLFGLLCFGVATFPDPESRPILFGMFYIRSELAFGIYYTLIGSLGVLGSIGLAKLHKYSWWLLLILVLELSVNSLIMLPGFIFSGLIGKAVEISVLVWIFCRRGYYIGTKCSQNYAEQMVENGL